MKWTTERGTTRWPPRHHLPFFRLAVACDSLLHLGGVILKNRQSHFFRRHEDNAPGLGYADASGDVMVKKQLFNGHLVWVELADEFLQVGGNSPQPGRQPHPRRGVDGSARRHAVFSLCGFHQAKAHDGIARINSEDEQRSTSLHNFFHDTTNSS